MILSLIGSTVEQADLKILDEIWQQVRRHLEAKKQRIIEEISGYPAPIPACDAQFNYLLEERSALTQELNELQEIRKRSLTAQEQMELLDKLVPSSRHLDGEAQTEIWQLMAKLTVADQ